MSGRSRRRGTRARVGGLDGAPSLERWAAGPLSLMLPGPAEADLLRACLWPGSAGAEALGAWLGWMEARGGPPRPPRWARPLLPLLHRSAVEAGLAPGGDLGRLLRAARAHEELRAERFAAAAAEVLERLEEAGFEPVVLPGAGLVEPAYGDWALRHCHDLDLLVPEGDLAGCLAALRDRCRVRELTAPTRLGVEGIADHPSGLPVRLHSSLLADRFNARPAAEVLDLSCPATVAGVRARRLTPPAALAYVLAQGALRSPLWLPWATDAWMLAGAGLDWEEAVEAIERLGVSLPASTLLAWMAAELRLECPPDRLGGLAAGAEGDPAARDAALSGAAVAGPGRPAAMLRAAGWGDGGRLMVALALPARDYLRACEGDSRLPRAYARRLLRYARQVLSARAGGWLRRARPG